MSTLKPEHAQATLQGQLQLQLKYATANMPAAFNNRAQVQKAGRKAPPTWEQKPMALWLGDPGLAMHLCRAVWDSCRHARAQAGGGVQSSV